MEYTRPTHSRRRSRRVRKRVLLAFLLFFVILAGVLIASTARYVPVLWGVVSEKQIQLKETKEKRVNLLLLGVGGGTHDGPDLTDTIIFASIDPETKKVILVSLPRDLWAPDVNAKINSVYTFADEKEKGKGLETTKAYISKLLGQQIDYAVKIDFSGFEKAVDMAGGLDIDVENTFDDYEYPLANKEADPCGLPPDKIASLSASIASGSAYVVDSFPCRYEHLHFDKGPQKMDGTTALKYVRSRHALGKEGSDFARSKRQEKVITAFKDKMLAADTLLNPVKVIGIANALQGSFETDIKDAEYDDFVRLAQKMKGAKVASAIIDTGDSSEERNGLLINPPISAEYGNQWVLSPRLGNGRYDEIQEYVACIIAGTNCYVGESGILTPSPIPSPRVQKGAIKK
jgi:LCP family protein required for cell wall assembly